MKKTKNKMGTEKLIRILIIVGIILIIYGLFLSFVSNLKKDQQQMNDRMKIIKKDYTKFNKNLKNLNKTREKIYTDFLDKIYYETLETIDTDCKNKLTDYETELSTTSRETKTLREYCKDGIYYSDSSINTKCNSFKIGYEEMVNSFVDDINLYNKNINNYNKWLEEQGNTTKIKLQKYETKKTYIDYNKDGKYSGKQTQKDK